MKACEATDVKANGDSRIQRVTHLQMTYASKVSIPRGRSGAIHSDFSGGRKLRKPFILVSVNPKPWKNMW